MLDDGREALVTACVETDGRGRFAALLEVVIAPDGPGIAAQPPFAP